MYKPSVAGCVALIALAMVNIAGCGLLNNDRAACRELPYEENQRFDHVRTISHDGLAREYLVHTPEGWDGESPLPVVLAFHGGGSRPEALRTASRLNSVADDSGFVVIYPYGTGPSLPCYPRLVPILTWNAGRCCGAAMEDGVDDVGFVAALLEDAAAHYGIDAARVYATGISNGAMMSYRLAVELSDRITAVGPVAGSLMIDVPPPPRAVPVIHFHGLDDLYAPYFGGRGTNYDTNPVEHNSIPATIDWWVDANDCMEQPVLETTTDYVRETYLPENAATGAPVVLYQLPSGGHTWPGGIDLAPELDTGGVVESVDASRLMWAFFEPFSLPRR